METHENVAQPVSFSHVVYSLDDKHSANKM